MQGRHTIRALFNRPGRPYTRCRRATPVGAAQIADLVMSSEPLIRLTGLSKTFRTSRGRVQALSDVSFDIPRGAVVGLVGESGSGKTTLGRCLLRLIEPTAGSILFDGVEVVGLRHRALAMMRRRMQIVFQDPYATLNPRIRVRDIIGKSLSTHGMGRDRADRLQRVADLLGEVGVAADLMHRFPHELSSGQRQRIAIAHALAGEPDFLVADESVSALDVSVQAQILNLMQNLCERRGLTLLFIAHDLSVVQYLCDEVVVLYLGRVVEQGPAAQVYRTPSHPYTRTLMSSLGTRPDPRIAGDPLPSDGPSALSPPSGCVFHTRCRHARETCRSEIPAPRAVDGQHMAACLRLGEI